MSSETPAAGHDPIALLQSVWDARAAGDPAVLEGALAPDARCRAIDDGPWNCDVLDDEQHIQMAQEHRVDVEEVCSQDRLGLPGQERRPSGRWR